MIMPRYIADPVLGSIPFLAALVAWLLLPLFVDYPAYMLPPLPQMAGRIAESIADGSLVAHTAASLGRLSLGFVIGSSLAIPLGIAIALNRHVSEFLRPVLTFLQAIAGIAWVPLAIIWFGIGQGAVVFIIANTIFFSSIYNTVVGVQSIPNALHRAVRCHGGRGIQVFTELILPGALVQIILGFRTSMAYGWRALVAGEMIAGTNGLGYMAIEAMKWYKTDTIIMGMILIGILWLVLDRLLFVSLEKATIVRWGLIQR
jgi:ABC-type nitrate/sulfonate/bicarbonate transport system permease component